MKELPATDFVQTDAIQTRFIADKLLKISHGKANKDKGYS